MVPAQPAALSLQHASRSAPKHQPVVPLDTCAAGFAASSAYQALYTAPRWEALVGSRLAARGMAPRDALPLLALFAAAFNVHQYAQGLVFKSEGAVSVGLVNAVRGAVITVVGAWAFCSPAKPSQCLTLQSGAAAAVTTLGGVVWVLSSTRQQQRQQQPVAVRTRAKSKAQ